MHMHSHLQVQLLPRHVPGLPERFDASKLLLSALNKFVFVRVRALRLKCCKPSL